MYDTGKSRKSMLTFFVLGLRQENEEVDKNGILIYCIHRESRNLFYHNFSFILSYSFNVQIELIIYIYNIYIYIYIY